MQVTQKMLQLGPLQDFWPLRMFGRAEDAQLLELAKLSRILQAESGCSEARQPGIPLWPLLVAKLHIDAVEEQQWQERLAGEGRNSSAAKSRIPSMHVFWQGDWIRIL